MWVRLGACHWSRRTSPQPFAPRGKGRFARVRGARQSADWLRPRPLRAPALSASVRRRGSLRPLRFARALDCCAICAAALRKLRFLRRISGGELRRTWHGRVRAFRGRPRLPPRSASGLGRPPHPPDAGHPALAGYRLRGLASPRRRGGASGRPRCARPRVRPRPALRAGGTTFGLPYGASLTLAPTLRRRSAALPQDGCIYPVAQPQ